MNITTIVVLYRPDPETLAFVGSYASAATPVVAVWNEFTPCANEPLEHTPHVTVLRNSTNVGLAKALNIGIAQAFQCGAESVFLLDQDSRPDRQLPHALLAARSRAVAEGLAVGLIGPTLHDRKVRGLVGVSHEPRAEYQIVQGLSTSGSLIDKAAFEIVGPMYDALFIDGIDHEWCYRAQSHGLCIVQSRTLEMVHDMGDAGINFFGCFKPIHRSPTRHYHITRNSLWLLRLRHVPKAFSLLEIAKMAYRIPAYVLVSTSTAQTLSSVFRGIRDGLFQKPVAPWVE